MTAELKTEADFLEISSSKIASFMDGAIEAVIGLGYTAAHCSVVSELDGPGPHRHVLVVCGRPAYEVSFGLDAANATFNISAGPLAWPSPAAREAGWS
jgi:hypothetical protein